MRHGFIAKKKFIKGVAAEAVALLLNEAEKTFEAHPLRSRRYVRMAFDLIKKHRIRLPRPQRLRFCKKCLIYWVPEKTVTITFESKHNAMLFACTCGAKRRIVMP